MRVVVCLKFIKFYGVLCFSPTDFRELGEVSAAFLRVTDLVGVLSQSIQFARESSYLQR